MKKCISISLAMMLMLTSVLSGCGQSKEVETEATASVESISLLNIKSEVATQMEALAKQYESVLPFIEQKRLDDWTHNKAIQKSVESYRISEEQKKYLKSLKVVRK